MGTDFDVTEIADDLINAKFDNAGKCEVASTDAPTGQSGADGTAGTSK